jgi:hypothetical protein
MSDLYAVEHGGQCCGIQHIHGFANFGFRGESRSKLDFVKAGIEKALNRYTSEGCDCGCGLSSRDLSEWSCAIECVLNEEQIDYWREAVEEAGFKQVFSFHNDNSGNDCFVFYLETNS